MAHYYITTGQAAVIQNLRDTGEYSAAYAYVAQIVTLPNGNPVVSAETKRWFEWAEQINGNAQTYINLWARAYTFMGAIANGDPITGADFQDGSDFTSKGVEQRGRIKLIFLSSRLTAKTIVDTVIANDNARASGLALAKRAA